MVKVPIKLQEKAKDINVDYYWKYGKVVSNGAFFQWRKYNNILLCVNTVDNRLLKIIKLARYV